MLSCAVWYQAAQICAVLSVILLMRERDRHTLTERGRQREADRETDRERHTERHTG